MPLRNLPGGVPEPEELFGRDDLIELVWRQLAGTNIMLVAPKRFGKTGVMRHILKRPRDAYLPVYVEAEDIPTRDRFAAALVASLLENRTLRSLVSGMKKVPRRVLDLVTGTIDEVGIEQFRVKLREALGESWDTVARQLILEMEKAKHTAVFIIDEFPQLLENIIANEGDDAARSFLEWFRSLRMRQKDDLRRFRYIIGGSTSIDMILRQLDVPGKLNDFLRVPVEPLTPDHAASLLDGLADTYQLRFGRGSTEKFFELVGPPVPYFIHLFVSQILLETGLAGAEITPDLLEHVYHKRVIGPTCRSYFDYYRQRLKRYGAPGERAAIAILRGIANSATGRVADSTLYDVYRKARKKGATDVEYCEIMADLEYDWYVRLDTTTNEYHFLMNIMRDWWHRFYRTIERKRR